MASYAEQNRSGEMLNEDQGAKAKVPANDRQHARASSYRPLPSSHTASGATIQQQQDRPFQALKSRRSLDLGAMAAAQSASGSGNSGAGPTNGHGNSSSSSGFGTLAGSIFGAATISSGSGVGGQSQPGSHKRTRPSTSHLFGLGGLFNASNATSDDKLSSSMAAGEHASSTSNNIDEREAALMGAVRAANDENAAWQIRVEQVRASEQDSLFLTGSNGGPATSSRSASGTATPLGRATQAAGRLFLSKTNKRNKPSPSASSSTSLERAKKRPHTDTQSVAAPGEAQTLLVLYVTTGTSSLTLYRGLQQLVQLDIDLRSRYPEHLPAMKPSALLELAAVESSGGHAADASTRVESAGQGTQGHARRRSVFAALGKSLKSNGKRSSPSHTLEHENQRIASPGSSNPDNGNRSDGRTEGSARQTASPEAIPGFSPTSITLSASQLTNVADYLSALSSFYDIRNSQEWKKFYRIRPDDHSSPHLEDRDSKKVKKLRSEADLPTSHSAQDNDATDHAPLHAHFLEDSGIGGDMSSHSMLRENSGGTGSSMSVFVEAGLDGTPLTVGDPEVLDYMRSLNTPAPESGLPVISDAEEAVTSVKEDRTSETKGIEEHAQEQDKLSHDTDVEPAQAEQKAEEPVVSALADSLAEEDEVVTEAPLLTPELANDALASLHAQSQPSTPAEEQVIEGTDQPLASASNSPPARSDVLPDEDNNAGEAIGDDPLSRKSSRSNPRSGRKRKASTKSSTVNTIGIEDFDIVRVLGKGCAGKVLLSRSKVDGSLYAVKAIHKQHVLAHRELLHTLTEQSILKKVALESDNPFVVRMSCSFQNKDNLFLVLDFHPGGDLATQLARWGRLGKDRSRFYAAEIVEGLEGLHAAGVIYRDLKPENILLASDGHILLTDFGLSKQFYRPFNSSGGNTSRVPSPPWLKDAALSNSMNARSDVLSDATETTLTFCGTAEYLAPEVLLGNPYSYPVDMWSLGTMVYEMLLGVTPFYNEDHGVMYRRVLHEQISFGDNNYLDADTRALLRGLLQKEPEFRMTTARVKKSKYFEAIDWEYVHRKRYIPPFIPALSADDPEDTQNFDEAFLKMDLGFVDQSDFEEAEVKAKRDGKEPDQPFDEEGRDVFEGYSFHGSPLYEESAEEDESSILAESPVQEEVDDEHIEPETTDNTAATAGTSGHEQLASDPGSNSSEDDPDAYETGVTSASGTDDGLSRHTKDTSHVRGQSNALSSLEEVESQAGSMAVLPEPEASATPVPQPAQPLPVRLHLDAPKNSIDMPRRSMEKEEQPAAPRKSEEVEDWDLLEAMEETEQAVNGMPKRRRVMAGPTLFARGFVDKYKLQIKPVTRAPTPSRSYKSSKNGISSPSGERGLSPSPSAAGMSQVSLTDSPDSSRPRRLKAPKLLRASTEWMSNSLPTSPSPRFRLNRNKRSLVPIALNKGSTKTEPGTRADTPISTSSSTTLPIEAAGAPLAPLTRHSTRRVDADAASGLENEDPNGDTSSFHSGTSKSNDKAAALLA